ncbi:DUF2335 domain-containing protein [Yunchengibacter salinarum]|uniref:DUF2335 domain-containing protein n=1 Tax=Yunchengibacter salinarum TaxID=3133399 RepID=UPI0035B5D4B6
MDKDTHGQDRDPHQDHGHSQAVPDDAAERRQVDGHEQQDAVLSAALVAQREFSGPIPNPEMLKEYDAVVPGSAEKIVRNWDDQCRHDRLITDRISLMEERSLARGQYLGLIALVLLLGSSIFAGFMGLTEIGLAIAAMGAAGIITVLVRGRNGN